MSNSADKTKSFCETPDEAVKRLVEIFGMDILADHRRFCSAFSDIAPRLSKENKSFYVAVSENVGKLYITLSEKVKSGETTPPDVNKRALAIVSEYLNPEKSRMVINAFSYAMGWEKLPDVQDSASDQDSVNSTGENVLSHEHNILELAENGDVNAQYNLGERYYFGNGVKHSYTKASHWYRKAAIAGDSNAQKRLADCYRAGQGIPKDYGLAVYWYGKAAEQGDYEAQKALVRCYKSGGPNLHKDIDTAQQLALRYGIKLSGDNLNDMIKYSAENGSIPSQLRYADMLFFGKGVSQDKTEAVLWYERAAVQNNAEAQYSLANCYASGEGTQQNFGKALYWYEKATANGNAEAANTLGCYYYYGKGTAKIPEKAVELFLMSAQAGNSDAQYNYGECCYNGISMLKNPAEAVVWYKKSASQGNPYAQYSLGWCHYFGEGVMQDYNTAKRLFELSAMQRNPYAQLALGYCYLNGQGTDRNFAKASQWFSKSASRGLAEGARMLVKCHATGGYFLPKDPQKAQRIADKYGVEYSEL